MQDYIPSQYEKAMRNIELAVEEVAAEYLQLEDAIEALHARARRDVINPDYLQVAAGDEMLDYNVALKRLNNLNNILEEHAHAYLKAEFDELEEKDGVKLHKPFSDDLVAMRVQSFLDTRACDMDSSHGKVHLEKRTIPHYAQDYLEALTNAERTETPEAYQQAQVNLLLLHGAVLRSLHLENPELQNNTMNYAVEFLVKGAIDDAARTMGLEVEDSPHVGKA